MKKIIPLLCLIFINSCSIYEAAHAPATVDYKKIQIGTTRNEVISVLGMPKLTENKDNKRVDTFEFRDGLHGASKSRIILYLAGDIFTAGLAELIFWPLESNAFDGTQCRGTLIYNEKDRVVGYDILDSKGNPLWISSVNN